jgi:hypothetical protein
VFRSLRRKKKLRSTEEVERALDWIVVKGVRCGRSVSGEATIPHADVILLVGRDETALRLLGEENK